MLPALPTSNNNHFYFHFHFYSFLLFFLNFWGVSVTCWSSLCVLSVIFNLLTRFYQTKVKLMPLCRAHDATDRVVCVR